ncbi:OmpW/AlkL family protein [Paraburkholderia dinghuensis]|uniref:OmpW family protein n=1 Tax=Paraburkholderia dinghuensis TaxID=2305225 RepID=A0A3N6MVL1_9BURK|nr:OmpW family outer membrane protein [Paraburkholderia dinghuensis]RQH07968.1 OmpW family protein [Paraburkholderia dinghuensis]
MKQQLKSVAAAAAIVLGAAFAAAPVSAADASTDTPGTGIHAGDILVRLRAIAIMPQSSTSSGSTLNAINAQANNAIVPELDFTYMFTNSIGAELILGTSRNQVTSNIGPLGGVGVLPPTLLLQYHFNHAGKVRPYVGAGINYTIFYNNGLHAGSTPVSIDNHSFGPALQMGIDIDVAKNVFINADIKKIWMRTGASAGGTSLGTLYIDPLIVGVGVGYRF